MDKDTESAVRRFSDLVARDHDVESIIVYGSRARGTHRPDSDVDVAVILRGEPRRFLPTQLAMVDPAYDIYLESGVDISPLPIWLAEWTNPHEHSNPALLDNIDREGIRLSPDGRFLPAREDGKKEWSRRALAFRTTGARRERGREITLSAVSSHHGPQIRKTERACRSARVLAEIGDIDGACDLACHAMFDAARAALRLSNECRSSMTLDGTHGDLLALFEEKLVDNGKLPRELGRDLRRAEDVRLAADFRSVATEAADALQVIELAERFVGEIGRMMGEGGGVAPSESST